MQEQLGSPTQVPETTSLLKFTIYDVALLESEWGKPSSEPSYWAKRSCNTCYGRGIEGTNTITIQGNKLVNEALCSCSRNRYERWKNNFVNSWIKENKDTVKLSDYNQYFIKKGG